MNLDISLLIPVMAIGPGCLESGPLGGSETAGVSLARALAARGHNLTVFGNVAEPCRGDGMTFVPDAHHHGHLTGHPHDVAIVQRIPSVLAARTESRLNYLWCHDLPVMQQVREMQGVSWNLDRIATVSEWMRGEYVAAGLDEKLVWASRNGIDLELIRRSIEGAPGAGKTFHKDGYRVVFAARPERGLDVLLKEVWPKLKKFSPKASLSICGYADAAPHMAEFYHACGQTIQDLNARGLGPVDWLGGLSKPELYRLLANSGCYLYPSPSPHMPAFAETSCLMSMECMATGLPFVASKRGALPETLGEGAGAFLIEGDPSDPDVAMRLAQAAAGVMLGNKERQVAVEAGLERAKALTWDLLAGEWEAAFLKDIAERNDDRLRLTRHFIRRQDIVAAGHALDEAPPSMVKRRLRAWIDERYGFIHDQEKFTAHYEKHAMDVPTPVFVAERERVSTRPMERYARIASLVGADVTSRPVGPVKLLDYGCHDGELDFLLLNQTWGGELELHGVDLNAKGIEWAERLRPEMVTTNANTARFEHIGFDWLTAEAPGAHYDLVICGEVLEHQPDPGAFLSALWRVLAPGGKLILTVPFGPWELGNATQPAMHLWEFDLHDLRDLMGHLYDFEVTTWRTGENEITGDALGYRLVTCAKVGEEEPAAIDTLRKLDLQRPRESLAANLLVGGPTAAETLRWCLKPLRYLCDEIVVADCGMDFAAIAIVQEFRARIVKADDPTQIGFDAARNIALDITSTDWVLWIDSDERLIGSECVSKYLRRNRFASYGLRQNHFAVDTSFRPDVPARLIRGGGFEGKAFQFYGFVHEHAELGEMNDGPGSVLVLSDASIAHVGYLSEKIRRTRFARNLPMLAKDAEVNPTRRIQKYLICRDNIQIARYEMEKNGGRVSPTVRRAAEETIGLYREYFLGKPEMMGMDCLSYYSQACRLLDIGFDVDLRLHVGRQGMDFQTDMPEARYATQEDFLADVAARARDMTRHYAKGYW